MFMKRDFIGVAGLSLLLLGGCASDRARQASAPFKIVVGEPVLDARTCNASSPVYAVKPGESEEQMLAGYKNFGSDLACKEYQYKMRKLEIASGFLVRALEHPKISDEDKAKYLREILSGMRSSDSVTAKFFRDTFSARGYSETTVAERVAIDDIHGRFEDLYRGNGQVNYPSVAAILGLYDQDSQPESKRRYPKLEQAFLRKEIDEALAARGLDIAGLKQMYEGARRNMECKTEQRNGYWQTRCGVEEPPVVYGP